MFANRFTVVTDACVLVPPLVRNMLLSLAEAHLYRVRWSTRILDEFERGFVRDVLRHNVSVPDAAALEGIPDPDDRHVVAAALHAGAAQIITNNLRDFPVAVMEQLQIDVRTADDFIADTLDLPMDSSTALSAVRRMRLGLKKPELTPTELLIRMERNGLGQTAALLAGRMELW